MNDKTKHFLVGAAFGMSALPLIYLLPFLWVVVITFATSSVVFFGKEVRDIPTTGFDKMDLVADYAGLFSGYVIVFIVKWIINVINL